MTWTQATNFFLAILAIVNPLEKIPLWIEASDRLENSAICRLAVMITSVGTGLLLMFLLAGDQILGFFGIDLASFKVAGGIIILLYGISMLQGRIMQTEGADGPGEGLPPALQARRRFPKIVVPMAVPLIAGPGSITTAIVYGSRVRSFMELLCLTAILLTTMGIVFGVLLLARPIQRKVGTMPLSVATRLFGLFLAAIAVQFVLEGLAEAFPQWVSESSPIRDQMLQDPERTSGG